MTTDKLRAEALDHVKRATEHSWGCSLNSMHGLVPVGTPCSCGLNEALAVLAASPTAPGLDANLMGRAVHRVFNHGFHGGGQDDADGDIGHALIAEYARLSEVQSDDR